MKKKRPKTKTDQKTPEPLRPNLFGEMCTCHRGGGAGGEDGGDDGMVVVVAIEVTSQSRAARGHGTSDDDGKVPGHNAR